MTKNKNKKNKNSKFVGLPSRRERRAEARREGVEFVPQYNGDSPMRVQHKDALKNQINAEKMKEKQKNRNKNKVKA